MPTETPMERVIYLNSASTEMKNIVISAGKFEQKLDQILLNGNNSSLD